MMMIDEGGGEDDVEDGGEGKDEGSDEGDFGCLRSFRGRQMDEQTDKPTFVNIESLSRPKMFFIGLPFD